MQAFSFNRSGNTSLSGFVGHCVWHRVSGIVCLADYSPEDVHSRVKSMTPCPCSQSFSSCCRETVFFFFLRHCGTGWPRTHSVAYGGLKFLTILPVFQMLDYRVKSSCLVYLTLGIEARLLCILGKCSTRSITVTLHPDFARLLNLAGDTVS